MGPSSRWRRRLWKSGVWLLATLLPLVLVAGLFGLHAVRRPLPAYDGTLTLDGLSAPVTVHRDGHGIPQIYADSLTDLYRAQGFVHGQDRFWEMDFRRHVTSGRLAELFGPDLVETDAFLRTLGWRSVAEAEWDLISPRTREYLTAYAEGVNAWIAQTGGPADTGAKALQYRVLGLRNPGYQVAPWDPVDTLAWLKAMAWDLRANLVYETDRAMLLASGLTRAQVEQLYPEYPYAEREPIVTEGALTADGFHPAGDSAATPDPAVLAAAQEPLAATGRAVATVPALLGFAGSGLGSNSWALHGDLTETGAPLLANDPHLGVSMPGIWYQNGLHCTCGHRVSGFSFSGVPGVLIGHNDRIAWGFTNLAHDVTDLYLERIDGDRYEVDGEWRDLTIREEKIEVAGGEDVTLAVRATHHGPVLSDVDDELADLAAGGAIADDLDGADPGGEGGGYGVSLAWTALSPGRTAEALFTLNQAGDWEEFRAAAALLEVPAQNLVYADVDGNIGYQAPGRVPVRGEGDGRWIAPGWDSAYDWVGTVPFPDLPYLFNPDDGYIVTANQAPVGPAYPHWLGGDWSSGHRSDRIHDLLAGVLAGGPASTADLLAIQTDSYHALGPVLVPALLAAADAPAADGQAGEGRAADGQAADGQAADGQAAALDLLQEWDFQQPADGEPGTPEARSAAAAAYFNATWRHLLALTFDELPEEHAAGGGGRWFDVVAGLLEEPDAAWWDRVGTAEVETRDDVLALALGAAYDELAEAQGDDPHRWRWGRMHTLTLREGAFGDSGIAVVEALFNRGPVETSGGTDAVNAMNWYAADGYDVVVSPSMRMVVDLSDLDSSRWIQMTGNSGHAFATHYDDQLALWRTGQTLPWRWDEPTIVAEAAHTLTLTPA